MQVDHLQHLRQKLALLVGERRLLPQQDARRGGNGAAELLPQPTQDGRRDADAAAQAEWYQARLNLALAAGGSADALKQARRLARRMKRRRPCYARVWATLEQATIAHLESDNTRSRILLEETWTLAEKEQILHLAAAARHRYGELVGGQEGADQLARAAAWMESEGVREPERMLAVWAPGWSS